MSCFLYKYKKEAILYGLFLSAFCFPGNSKAASLNFEGCKLKPITIQPDKKTGLDAIYVLYSLENVNVSFKSENTDKVIWKKYDNLGGAFAEEFSNVKYEDNISSISGLKSDTGIIITEGDRSFCFWIIDYSDHNFKIESLSPSIIQDCESSGIDIQASGDAIHYYNINGKQETLSREIELKYTNLFWNEDSQLFEQEEQTRVLSYLTSQILISPALYCNSEIDITGDRFLKSWNLSESYHTEFNNPVAVNVITKAETELNDDSEDSNQITGGSDDSLGGSAPVTIEFKAYISDAVIHNEWQISSDEDFEDISYRINDQDFSYTFTDEGRFYVRYIGSNYDGSCEAYGETYSIAIGSSVLKIPNAFTPNGDGVNDEWKVSYRSLIRFKCKVFDIQGHELYSSDDPAQGWDGRFKGKLVSPGVYYYVIEAKGADGRDYKKSGDINIIRSRDKRTTDNI